MPSKTNPMKTMTRRAALTTLAAGLATPAIAQLKGAFDELGPNVDPNDLIDKIWDPAAEKLISIRDLIDRLVDTEIILIGERHGYAPHQDREAFLLQALADRGRYPALAMEMLVPDQEPVIQRYRKRNPEYTVRLGIELNWSSTGWPDWDYYQPVFDSAFIAKLPIIAADLPLDQQREIERNGMTARPSDPWVLESWTASMADAHCNLISNDQAQRLGLKQWQRDIAMARSLTLGATQADGAILIAGQEHTRPDRGVPRYLGDNVAGIAFEPTPSEGRGWLSWGVGAKEKTGGFC